MYDMFRNFGTVLYLRRGMQKRAYYAKKAVGYLEKAGAFKEPSGRKFVGLVAAR